jgi:polyisoprenoid-binding protein YceI
MKRMIKLLNIGVLTILWIAFYQTAMAQVQYKLDPAGSSVLVKGTSSLHDWEMKAEKISGSFTLAEDQTLDRLTSGNVVIDASSLKSEHSLMNKKACEALKQKSYPRIEAKLLRVEQNQNTGKVQLELTIAGKSRQTTENFQFKNQGNGKVEISGVLNLKMSDFGVEPPVALMGTIKTGNEIKIEYRFMYQR